MDLVYRYRGRCCPGPLGLVVVAVVESLRKEVEKEEEFVAAVKAVILYSVSAQKLAEWRPC